MSGDDSDTSDEDYLPENDNDARESSSSEENDVEEENCIATSPSNEGSTYATISKSRDELWLEFLGEDERNLQNSCKNKDHADSAEKSQSNGSDANISKKVQHNGSDSNVVQKIQKSQAKAQITQILEFAGEEIKVEKEVDLAEDLEKCSGSNTSKSNISQSSTSKFSAPTGLSGVLSEIGKKRKIGTLEKSQIDWKLFKKASKIDEELEQYNRGKGGYLDKQEFLQRVDYKQFERERELRNSSRKKPL